MSAVTQTFVPATASLEKQVIIFVDDYASHTSMAIHEVCKEHNIFYYLLPVHASHIIIQPLDLIFYKSLKTEWAAAARSFKQIHGHEI